MAMAAERTWNRRLAAALCVAALGLAGCGSDDESGASGTRVARSGDKATPEAATTSKATGGTKPIDVSEPEKPESLRLLDGGNPTVYLRLKQTVDLYDEPGGKVVESVGHSTSFGSRTVYAVTDQQDDWAAVLTPYTENGEPLWLELDPERLKAGRSAWDIEVDLSEFETRVYENGKLVKTFQVSVGMPTSPTPTGRFAITDTFRGGLNAAYGCCALATTGRQVNLPSGWLGGDRIAFHGTTGPLGAEVSHGCVRAADRDISDMVDMVPPGTPVEVHE
ncbi:MAG: L,D-transpeptidase [Actinomycetota bacterium]|nr:L,D-transpeptidase [Actinomycetota bacterium]